MSSSSKVPYNLPLRPDDQNNQDGHLQVPTLAKVLELAADIADGMAYLGNKKIIHRYPWNVEQNLIYITQGLGCKELHAVC